MDYIQIDGESLTISQVIAVAYHRAQVEISGEAWQNVRASRLFLEAEVGAGKTIYGINTGFGSLASEHIDIEATASLQRKLLLSHACGVGPHFSPEIVRAIMLIRLNTLLAGYSGIQEKTLLLLQALLNQQIHPIIPSQGSVGASGDLCPLSHMALALIGEGEVMVETQENGVWASTQISAVNALKMKGLEPVILQYKEGIALNNGTSVMTALGVLGVYESKRVLNLAIMSAGMAFEGLCARKQAFDAKIHAVRRHSGQAEVARHLREFTRNSTLMGISAREIIGLIPPEVKKSWSSTIQKNLQDWQNNPQSRFPSDIYTQLPAEINTPRWRQWSSLIRFAEKKLIPQDAYSVRCLPQVLGASLEAINHAETVISHELNAVVDNPLLFKESGEVLSGGNFHGQPLALVLDYLKLAIAEMGNLLERQINKLLDSATNDGLPPFLAENPGLDSGWMIPQYAAAGLVSENKVLVHPASADSIPTSANQEDHVSMGTIGGRQALEMLENVRKIVAIHLLTSAQALDVRCKQLQKINFEVHLGIGTHHLRDLVRQYVPYLEEDRFLYPDIQLVMHNFEQFLELANTN
jgi:histidine ammonia-lyase